MWLRSGIAVAVAQAGRCSSSSTPSPGTLPHAASMAIKKKKKKKPLSALLKMDHLLPSDLKLLKVGPVSFLSTVENPQNPEDHVSPSDQVP